MVLTGFSLELAGGALTGVAGVSMLAACRHGGGVVLSDGRRLYRLGGESDDGTPIAVRVRLPPTDCGVSGPKRLLGVALEGMVAGAVTVGATSDSGASLEGEAGPCGGEDQPGHAVARLGRGYGVGWQVELVATDGAALDVGAVVLGSLPLDRRWR